jgi:hypothetical protein
VGTGTGVGNRGGRGSGLGSGLIVAVDGLGAGPGERVIVAHGSRVRDLTVGPAVADKDIVVAIVDGLHVDEASARQPPPPWRVRASSVTKDRA